ncbi:MAG: hypothetical protein IJ017_08720 [Oscillospiraceae bacterium]|nr:hypothetical protein [Oscillospiraceae bacterium]
MERRNGNIRKRISYYDDYKKTASGEYVYSGLRYEYESMTGKKRSVWMREILLMCIAAFAVMFPPGFMHVPGLSYCAYVLLPYGAAIIVSGYLLVIAGRLAMAKDDVKAWEYDKSIKAFPAATILLAVVSVIGIICEIIYVVLNGMNGRTLEFIVYMVCQLISGALAILISRQVKTVNWKVIESNSI